jgi:hypothetical protein
MSSVHQKQRSSNERGFGNTSFQSYCHFYHSEISDIVSYFQYFPSANRVMVGSTERGLLVRLDKFLGILFSINSTNTNSATYDLVSNDQILQLCILNLVCFINGILQHTKNYDDKHCLNSEAGLMLKIKSVSAGVS